jgi:hypothetical protein
MASTSVKEVSPEPAAKWTRSEWFGMPGRSVLPPPPVEEVTELECVRSMSDKMVQTSGFRDTLSGTVRAKRVA